MITETATTLSTPDGTTLEARMAAPPGARAGVVVCHPHPLYGGDMENPVVIRVVEVCGDQNLATLRFNFRGVGGSTGRHGNGIAEREDIKSALGHLSAALPPRALVGLSGYSFGAVVAASVAADHPALAGLCLIAPPLSSAVGSLPANLATLAGPLAVVAGTRDEYCPPEALEALAVTLPNARVSVVEGANHFFFGKLFPLGELIATWARAMLQA